MTTRVLDTDVVIAALDRADAHHPAAREAFSRFASTRTELVICTVNYAEALARPAEDERDLRAAVDAIASLGIRTFSPDAGLARLAARRRALGVSLADGSRSPPQSGWTPSLQASTAGCAAPSKETLAPQNRAMSR